MNKPTIYDWMSLFNVIMSVVYAIYGDFQRATFFVAWTAVFELFGLKRKEE